MLMQSRVQQKQAAAAAVISGPVQQPVSKSKTKKAAATSDSPVPTDTPAPTADSNPYIEVVSKRLRTLKKRLMKIEKYEEDLRSGSGVKLNEDQLQAINKKEEVANLIKEMEDLVKQMREKDSEEAKRIKAQKKAEVAERVALVEQTVTKLTDDFKQQVQTLAKFFVAGNKLVSRVPFVVLTAEERDSITAVTSLLVQEAVAEDVTEQLLKQVESTLAGLMKAEGDYLAPVAAAQKALDFIQTPAAPEPQFTVEPVDEFVVAEEPAVVVMPAATQSFMPTSGPVINFMTSSSVLVEEESMATQFTDPAIVSSQLKSVSFTAESAPAPVEEQAVPVQQLAAETDVPPPQQQQQQSSFQPGSRRPSRGRGGYRGGYRGGSFDGQQQQQQQASGNGGYRGRGRGGSWRGGSRRPSTANKQQQQQQQ